MDNATLISLFSLGLGFLSAFTVLCLKLLFKSKCSDVNICFGFFKIKRDIENEFKIEELELGKINNNKEGRNNNTSRESINNPITI